MTRRKAGLYTLYKGEELLDVGTVRELAERTGRREEYIRWLATPSYKRRAEGHDRLAVYRVEDE